MEQTAATSAKHVRRERWNLLITLKKILDLPMIILAFVWLALTVVDLTRGLSPFFSQLLIFIWIIFALHFLIEFFLAPDKVIYLKHNWLTGLSLLLPAFRILRAFRVLRYVRFLRGTLIIRILSAFNRGARALSKNLGKRGFVYVFCLTLIVILLGAAGAMSFEKGNSPYFDEYASAIWWASMMVTTMGTDYYPETAEGRLVALFLAIYGFAIFGYLTATVASLFIEKDQHSNTPAVTQQDFLKLENEIRDLKVLLEKSP